MPILITGLFEPSDGAHGFDLLNDTDLGFVDLRAVNTVLAGPASGGSAAAAFRALVAADIPGLSGTYQPLDADLTTIAGLAVTRGDILIGSSVPGWTDLAIGVADRFLGSNGTDPAWTAPGALTKVDDTNVTLTLGGTPTTALLRAASLTLGWTGTLGVARGGTNLASYAVGDLLYASGATTIAKLADVAVGSYLRSGGVTTAPLWSTTTLPNSATVGALLHASATNVYTNLDDIATGNVLLSGGVGVVPAWGKVALTTHVSGVLPIANGGSNKALTLANGGILWTDADSYEVSAAGTLGQLLRSAGAAAPTWTTATFPATAGSSGNVLTSDGTNWASSAPAGGGSVANPTALVGLTAVNGVATSAIRSDGAPALDQAITPTWTGAHTFNNLGGGVYPHVTMDVGTDTTFYQLDDPNTGFNMKFELIGGAGITANRVITFLDGSGSVLTNANLANVSSKTFTTGNAANTAAVGGTGWYFRDTSASTKRFYLDLSGLTALNHSLKLVTTGTVAKIWTLEDMSGSLVAAGNGGSSSVVSTTNGTTAVTSATLFSSATDPVLVGQTISGSLIPVNNWVTVKTDASNITIAVAATGSSTVARTYSPQVDAAAKINMTALTKNVGTSAIPLLLTNATPVGFYRISAVMTCTTGAAGADVTLNVTWTGDSASATRPLSSLVMTTTGGIALVTSYTAYLASGNFTFYTSGWTAGTYALRIRMEFLGA